MPKIKINDVNLYYETYGKGDPLVLINGFSADLSIWENVVEEFAKHYQVIVFDNRGSGRSDVPDFSYSMDMFADDAIGLCKALGINSAHFMGVSMGGMIVQSMARRYPNFMKAAVIENSSMFTDIRFGTFAQGKYQLMVAKSSPRALEDITLPWVFSSNFLNQAGMVEELIREGMGYPYPITTVGYKNQLKALLEFDSRSWIKEIQVPCLVISGDQDIIFDETDMRRLANSLPHAEYYCFRGVGHLPHIERPDEFCKIALQFLAEYTPTTKQTIK